MFVDSTRDDFVPSRFRWYDVPAIVLGHRLVRCRMCGDRYFGVKVREERYRILGRLWMHYVLFVCLVVAGLGMYLRAHPQLTSRGIEQVSSAVRLWAQTEGE